MDGSAAPAGEAFAELVAVMDRLRSPGGCPWDAEQTHASLAPYAIEEAYEVVEAAEHGDLEHLCEELGDLLLQVVFHARIAQEDPVRPFDAVDVVRGLVAKLERRHPHVFGDVTVTGAADVAARWDEIKHAERRRSSVLDGVPRSLPALMRAQKLVSRAGALAVPAPGALQDVDADVGFDLLRTVARADARGVDAEAALRSAVEAYAAAVGPVDGRGVRAADRSSGEERP